MGARAQVGARAAVDAVLDDGLDGDGLIDGAAAADGGVGEAAVGAELALLAHGDVADQMRLRPHDGVAADNGIGADPGLRGSMKVTPSAIQCSLMRSRAMAVSCASWMRLLTPRPSR